MTKEEFTELLMQEIGQHSAPQEFIDGGINLLWDKHQQAIATCSVQEFKEKLAATKNPEKLFGNNTVQ